MSKNYQRFPQLDASLKEYTGRDDGSIMFLRSLELIKAEIYKVEYPEFKARALFPVSNEGGPGITGITNRWFDPTGRMKVGRGSTSDIPRVDVIGGEYTTKVAPFSGSFGYDYFEMQQALQSSRNSGLMNLDSLRVDALRQSYEYELNYTAFFGNAEYGLPGFLTNTEITKGYVAADGTGSTDAEKRLYTNKTAEQLLASLIAPADTMWTSTKMVERPNRLLLFPNLFTYIHRTYIDAYKNKTIFQALMETDYLRNGGSIEAVNEFVGTGTGGVNVIAWYNKNPRKVELNEPMTLRMFPVQEVGLEYVTNAAALNGGLTFRYPKSASIAEGL